MSENISVKTTEVKKMDEFNYDEAIAEIKGRTLYPHGNSLDFRNIVSIVGTLFVWLAIFSALVSATSLVVHKLFGDMGGHAAILMCVILIALYALIEFKTINYHKKNGVPFHSNEDVAH